MSTDGQRTLWRRSISENFNRLSRAHERHRRQTDDRRQTDGRTMTYSEHELEFTFANKRKYASEMKTMNVIGLNATCGENFTAEDWMQLQCDCCYNGGQSKSAWIYRMLSIFFEKCLPLQHNTQNHNA